MCLSSHYHLTAREQAYFNLPCYYSLGRRSTLEPAWTSHSDGLWHGLYRCGEPCLNQPPWRSDTDCTAVENPAWTSLPDHDESLTIFHVLMPDRQLITSVTTRTYTPDRLCPVRLHKQITEGRYRYTSNGNMKRHNEGTGWFFFIQHLYAILQLVSGQNPQKPIPNRT